MAFKITLLMVLKTRSIPRDDSSFYDGIINIASAIPPSPFSNAIANPHGHGCPCFAKNLLCRAAFAVHRCSFTQPAVPKSARGHARVATRHVLHQTLCHAPCFLQPSPPVALSPSSEISRLPLCLPFARLFCACCGLWLMASLICFSIAYSLRYGAS